MSRRQQRTMKAGSGAIRVLMRSGFATRVGVSCGGAFVLQWRSRVNKNPVDIPGSQEYNSATPNQNHEQNHLRTVRA